MSFGELFSSFGFEVIYLLFGISPDMCTEEELRHFSRLIHLSEEDALLQIKIKEILNVTTDDGQKKKMLLSLLVDPEVDS
jgi:hypothetical protein